MPEELEPHSHAGRLKIADGASPKDWYSAACASRHILPDDAQLEAIEEMEALWRQLMEFRARRNRLLGRSLLSPKVPTGLYLWGGVGRGKTFLMDSFFHSLPYRRKRRIHFHQFMSEVHHEMKLLACRPDPLMAVADLIATSTRLLSLDEFHIDDIADAMIMGRLLEALFERGVILLTTSNFPPHELYPNGLQRERFLPAIDLLVDNLTLVHVDGSNDYRLLQMSQESLFLVPDNAENDAKLEQMFLKLVGGHPSVCALHLAHQDIPAVGYKKGVAWFDFGSLCGGNHDQHDYLEIARQCQTILLSGIPLLGRDNGDKARRFTWLIDVMYDHRVKLVASGAAPPDKLFTDTPDNDSLRTQSRLVEMQTRHYLDLPHQADLVKLN